MNPGMRDRVGAYLEQLYERYNRPECVPPDPLQFPLRYGGAADREVVALLAASLAFGGVGQIATAVETVLERLGDPAAQVTALTEGDLRARLAGFRHRFVTGTEVAALLAGAGALIRRHGSLGACFADLQREEDETVLPALGQFVDLPEPVPAVDGAP